MSNMILVARNGWPQNVEEFMYDHALEYGFTREQVIVYRYYYKASKVNSAMDELSGLDCHDPLAHIENREGGGYIGHVTNDEHASHFLYILTFKNDKDAFLYRLRYSGDNVAFYYKYDEWNTKTIRDTWKSSVQELLDDGHFDRREE